MPEYSVLSQDVNVFLEKKTMKPYAQPCLPSTWEKIGIILEPHGADEGDYIQNFTCVARPIDNNKWQLWYSVNSDTAMNIAVAEGVPGESMHRYHAILSEGEPEDAPLAIGNLPAGWNPVQPVHVKLPDGRNRLYFWAHGPGVVRYLAAESNDGRRYRVLDAQRPCLYHCNDRASIGVKTVEGLTLGPSWGERPKADEPDAPAELICNDATNVYLLSDGTWELYSPGLIEVAKDDQRYIAYDNAAGWVRVIDRWTSNDGLRWTDRQRVITPDASDPADMQFYHLSVTHTPQGRVGMLGHYRVEAQTMDIEWCFSEDGIHWDRPLRHAWLPRGEEGNPDCYGIYPPHSLVWHNGYWWLFYTGVNITHNNKRLFGRPRSIILAAKTNSIWQN